MADSAGMGDGGGKSVPDTQGGRKCRAKDRTQYSKCSMTGHRGWYNKSGIRKV